MWNNFSGFQGQESQQLNSKWGVGVTYIKVKYSKRKDKIDGRAFKKDIFFQGGLKEKTSVLEIFALSLLICIHKYNVTTLLLGLPYNTQSIYKVCSLYMLSIEVFTYYLLYKYFLD